MPHQLHLFHICIDHPNEWSIGFEAKETTSTASRGRQDHDGDPTAPLCSRHRTRSTISAVIFGDFPEDMVQLEARQAC